MLLYYERLAGQLMSTPLSEEGSLKSFPVLAMRGNGKVKIVPKLGENISFLSVFLKGSNTVPEGEVGVFRGKKKLKTRAARRSY